ncbi:MAG TPA: 23S rRNA (guanosine(2251)-2'-O)-methyltransferase RlmB [Bacillales bacterium]|nr:23S rRNA (guanosine(2251)-2'-O)-methyltransferase RlmB [Bacillales bacterium]
MGTEFIVGKNPVTEALKAGRDMNKIWINERAKGSMQPIIRLAKRQGLYVQPVPKQKLDQLAGGSNHQGVVASVAAYRYAGMDELFKRAADKGEEPFFVVLDEIEDPHNLGAILRTADAAGVHGAIIPKRRSPGLTSVVAKASAGAVEHVPVVRVTNLARTMDELKKRGLWFCGADAAGEQDYREADFDLALGLVIGNEGKGISRLVKEKCDFLVRLPMAGRVSSLNASVASALLMYEVFRKRNVRGV